MTALVYRKPADLPQTIPLFPLPGAIVFPRGVLPLNIFEPRYLNMIDDALAGDRIIGMIQPANADEDANALDLSDVGTAARITSFSETEDGRYLISLTGICRFRVQREVKGGSPYRQAIVAYDDYAADRTWNEDAARKQLITIFEAAGASSDITRTGRRRLSSILFS